MHPILRNARAWLGLGGIALWAAAMASCFSPSYSQAIYMCEGTSCPSGLFCNVDRFCVDQGAAGCSTGGIQAGDNLFLCPGKNNRCATGFTICPMTPNGLACPPPMTGTTAPPPCFVCCPGSPVVDMDVPRG